MNPTSQTSRPPSRLDKERSSSRSSLNLAAAGQTFHAPLSEVRSAGRSVKVTRPIFAPGFRDISNEFLGTETKRNYVAEVLFFIVIVGISAWPIVSMLQALARL